MAGTLDIENSWTKVIEIQPHDEWEIVHGHVKQVLQCNLRFSLRKRGNIFQKLIYFLFVIHPIHLFYFYAKFRYLGKIK